MEGWTFLAATQQRQNVNVSMLTDNGYHGYLMSAVLQWSADAHMPEISNGPKRTTTASAAESCRLR